MGSGGARAGRLDERASLANLVALAGGALPAMAARVDLSWVEILVAVPALVVLVGGFGLVVGTGFAFLLRPMVDEVLAELPSTGIPSIRRRWSVAGRFYAAIGSTCFLSGLWVAAFAVLADTRESRLVVTVSVSAVTALYMLLLFGGLLVRPTLAPMADLVRATVRVRHGDFAQPVPVTSADGFGDLAIAFNEMQVGLREREALQAAFGSYVDPVLAQRLVDSGSDLFEGEDVVVTVLFADVRDFTAHAERIEPSDAVALLNRLFDVIVPVLHEHGGHANHYLGDGLLAIFGAPSPLEHHASASVAAAIEVHRRVRDEFGASLRLGIGINTGSVIAGTVGGGGRHEFTVIGDTVNVAARVEQLTKETGDAVPRDGGDPCRLLGTSPPSVKTRGVRGPGQGEQGPDPCREPVSAIDSIDRARTLNGDVGVRTRVQRTLPGRRGVQGGSGPRRLGETRYVVGRSAGAATALG